MFLTLAAPGGRGHIVPAGSVSRPLRVNRQSYELKILWLYIKFYLEQGTDKKNFVGQVHFAHWAFCRGRVKLIGYRWCAN